MPAFNPATKQRSIERLISTLQAGQEISRRDLNTVLRPEQQQELDAAWRHQQALRAVKKPLELSQYERLHKQALLMHARYQAYQVDAQVVSNVIVDRTAKQRDLEDKCQRDLQCALSFITKALQDQPALQVWLDRHVDVTNEHIGMQLDLLPFVVTSRSTSKRVDAKQRFGWKTIKQLRLEALGVALTQTREQYEAWHRQHGYVLPNSLTQAELEAQSAKLKELLERVKRQR
jgi:hypothetical protein